MGSNVANLKIIVTADGSPSLLNEEMNETYHSTKGAMGESQYVFIDKGFQAIAELPNVDTVRILEIGFGTGLNALLTAQQAFGKSINCEFTTLETVPLSQHLYRQLDYSNTLLLQSLHECEWNDWQVINEQFKLMKLEKSLETFETEDSYDLIYFDAFAPSKQPEIWSVENLTKCHTYLKPGGILVTYCSQGQFKRDLKSIGFEVEVLPGAMGKKEMVRGHKSL